MRKYQAIYDAIENHARLQATEVYNLSGSNSDIYVATVTKNRYATACRLIREGKRTESQLLNTYNSEKV